MPTMKLEGSLTCAVEVLRVDLVSHCLGLNTDSATEVLAPLFPVLKSENINSNQGVDIDAEIWPLHWHQIESQRQSIFAEVEKIALLLVSKRESQWANGSKLRFHTANF